MIKFILFKKEKDKILSLKKNMDTNISRIIIRKATQKDSVVVQKIYDNIHTEEENGRATIGWIRGIYPDARTIKDALERQDLFVAESDGKIIGTVIFNQLQVDSYKDAPWQYDAPASEIMVMHTLVIDPSEKGRGLGKEVAKFYEQYALDNGCHYLRIDTNEKNSTARSFYKKLGYKEIGIKGCTFNGIKGVNLVLLEKKI